MPYKPATRESTLVRRIKASDEALAATLTKRPLTRDQQVILRSIAKAPWPGHGWTWENNSTTTRLLDALAKRGLVTVAEAPDSVGRVRTTYTATSVVRTALREVEAEAEAARVAHDAERDAEKRERDLRAYHAKVSLVRTLEAALTVAIQEGALLSDSEATQAALAHVAALAEAAHQDARRLDLEVSA